jgi:hypothetical protein
VNSYIITACQSCGCQFLKSILFLGYLPLVNKMRPGASRLQESSAYPVELLHCSECQLVQLSCIVDPKILFDKEYPYTSSTTKALRDNFKNLTAEFATIRKLKPDDLVVDIGSNDGNLLSNFVNSCRVLGVTPENIGQLAVGKGIPTIADYFGHDVALRILRDHGKAKLVTATNVFSHIDKINFICNDVKSILDDDGVFVIEVQYLEDVLRTLQYDSIYHEHQRYYSLTSLKNLLERNGLEVFRVRRISTHGGSLRVYVARPGVHPVEGIVPALLKHEEKYLLPEAILSRFKTGVAANKIAFWHLISKIKKAKPDAKIYGVGAPSRAAALINYLGFDADVMSYIVETQGSYKIGKYLPGTAILIAAESKIYTDQPSYALILSWHIANDLIKDLRAKGFKGKLIIPLPDPVVVDE